MFDKNTFMTLLLGLVFLPSFSTAKELTDKEVKQLIISESIRSYPGSCPCPYNTDRAGRRCGKRSAYLRAGGYAPLCYEGDVTEEMISRYKKD